MIEAPLFISTATRYAATETYNRMNGSLTGTFSATNWPAANRAIFVPLKLPFPYPAKRAFWVNGGSAAGNVDIGIYTINASRIWSSGSTAQSGTNLNQYVTCGKLIPPGYYYLALAMSSTSSSYFNSAFSVTYNTTFGIYQMAAAFPLPDAATFAATANSVYPLFGLTRSESGF
jgi:hypothetical protein